MKWSKKFSWFKTNNINEKKKNAICRHFKKSSDLKGSPTAFKETGKGLWEMKLKACKISEAMVLEQ